MFEYLLMRSCRFLYLHHQTVNNIIPVYMSYMSIKALSSFFQSLIRRDFGYAKFRSLAIALLYQTKLLMKACLAQL